MVGACAGLRPGLLRRVVRKHAVSDAGGSRLYVTKDGSLPHRPTLPMELPRHASRPRPQAAVGAFPPCHWWLALPTSRHKPVQPLCGDAEVGHVSFRERAAPASLACRESWRGHGYALGFMAATFQRKQSPRLLTAFGGFLAQQILFASRCSTVLRPLRGAASPAPAVRFTTRTRWARPRSTRKEKHHG